MAICVATGRPSSVAGGKRQRLTASIAFSSKPMPRLLRTWMSEGRPSGGHSRLARWVDSRRPDSDVGSLRGPHAIATTRAYSTWAAWAENFDAGSPIRPPCGSGTSGATITVSSIGSLGISFGRITVGGVS